MKIFAHRGFSAHFPENTPLAFKEAAGLPINGIELDVHMTSDGEVVICHDERIDRTSNGRGFIKDLSLKELKSYNFYGKFPEKACKETEIWTLEEFMDWFKDKNMIVNIELKTNLVRYPHLVEKVVNLIQNFHLTDRVIISSFNHYSVLEVKKKAPEITAAFLAQSVLIDPVDYLKKYNIDYYHPQFLMINPQDITACHEANIKVNPYTVNYIPAMHALEEAGIDCIITDEIALALHELSPKEERIVHSLA